ncbi:MAG TPA: hypothetical protein DCZ76_09310 [Treponema sp.]|nr:hypothetical protein [Treponema sp.]
MTKLQLKLAQKYEENSYNAALNFWAENQDEIKSLSEQERDDLKKMMLRYCKINKDESSALTISQDRDSPQNKEIVSFLFELARIYNDGKSVDKNTVKAERLYEMLLEGGDSDDLYKLGEMYKSGDGVAKNDSKAAECFKKSAVGGNKLAAYRLGEMYMTGCGVEKSRTEAENWYNAANAEKNVYSNTISRMVIPDGITNISKSAFEGLENLRSVVIPNSVNRIETKAFSGCTALESVTFSNEKISIEKDAFKECKSLNEEARKIIERRCNSFFVFVNGGSFFNRDTCSNISVSSFEIGRYLVTKKLYEDIMGKKDIYSMYATFSALHKEIDKDAILLPVNVDWYDAVEFCNKLSICENLTPCYTGYGNSIKCDFSLNGYRLPTEAEWEFAARGGNRSGAFNYSGGNKLSDIAWHKGNSENILHEVGQKESNELGIYDMSGNVWEWCWDWYDDFVINKDQINPRGASFGSSRVLRGGCYRDSCVLQKRDHHKPNYYDDTIGFRVARTVGKKEEVYEPKMMERMFPSDIY